MDMGERRILFRILRGRRLCPGERQKSRRISFRILRTVGGVQRRILFRILRVEIEGQLALRRWFDKAIRHQLSGVIHPELQVAIVGDELHQPSLDQLRERVANCVLGFPESLGDLSAGRVDVAGASASSQPEEGEHELLSGAKPAGAPRRREDVGEDRLAVD
jgi:hypothetical protein